MTDVPQILRKEGTELTPFTDKKLRLREVQEFGQGHMVLKWQIQAKSIFIMLC